MKRIARSFILCIAIEASAHRACASSAFAVTLDDFTRRSMSVETFDGETLVGVDADRKVPATVPATRLLLISRGVEAASPREPSTFVLARTDGERLVGKPDAIVDDALTFSTTSLGEWKVPLTSVVSLTRGNEIAPTAASPSQDEVRLANGDAIIGIVSEASDQRVTCKSSDGQAVPIEWANVRQVRFAPSTAADVAAQSTPRFRIAFADGSLVGVSDVRLANDRVTARSGERTIDVAASAVVQIELLGGATRLLSNVAPSAASSAPFFPRFGQGVETDRAAATIAALNATSAIAARPHAMTTWPTAGATSFHARYAIPAGLPRADVSIRVLADERVVFERSHVRAGVANAPIDVPLAGAKSVTLEVGYGDNYDAQDNFYWLDAALVGASN